MSLHVVVILYQCLNLIDGEDGCIYIVVFQPCMLVQVSKDIFRNGSNTLIGMIQFVKVNLMTLAVFRIVQCLRFNLRIIDTCDGNASHVLNREPKHIAVSNGLLNHVLMNAGVKLPRMEDVCRCLSLRAFVFGKDRRTCEPDVVGILEMLANLSMHLSELRAMALIDDEHAFLLSECIHNGIVLLGTECRRHFLDSRDNQRL